MPAHLPDHAWYVTKTYEAQSLTDPRSKSSAWGSANQNSPKPTSRVRTTDKQKKILTIRGILEINLPPVVGPSRQFKSPSKLKLTT